MAAEKQQGTSRAASVLAARGTSTGARLLGTVQELGYVRKLPDTQGHPIGSLGEDVIETADRIGVGPGMISAVPPKP